MEDIRAFIAIKLPEEVKAKLNQLEDQFKSKRLNVKWVNPENIHLTIKFLGNIGVDSIPKIQEIIEEAALEIVPFKIGVNGVGVFPNAQRVQVIWAGLNGELDKLIQLQKLIDTGLSRLGFVPESRPFTAHLTIARMRDEARDSERETAGKLTGVTLFETSLFIVESVSLMRSQLRREGPIYTQVFKVDLVG
jgi:RNA 2',3'-cyclic 3'-phosphodiesterase